MLTLDDREKAVAGEKARSDFYFYARYLMLRVRGVKWMRAPHHEKVCDALMRVFRGECKRLLINIPPRYSKTQLVTDFITYSLGHFPDAEFMYLSYSDTMAVDKTGAALDDILHPAYHEIFPNVELKTTARGKWETTVGGMVYGAGAAGTVTGIGPGKMRDEGFGGCLIYDDPHKPEEVFSVIEREKVIRIFQNTVEYRLAWHSTPIIVIAHCLHEEDLIAWLIAGRNGEEWERICFPAINDDGTALWPQKHSIETLRRMQEKNAYTFSSQFMQRPTPVGGTYFNVENFLVRVKDSNPPRHVPVEMPKVLRYVWAEIDTPNKDGPQHDGLGVVFFGLRPPDVGDEEGRVVILDYDYSQMEGASLIDWLPSVFTRLEELARQCGSLEGVAGVWIEDKGSGIVLVQQARNKGLDAHPIDSKLSSISKAARCFNVSEYIFGDKVKITDEAYHKTVVFKQASRNHLMTQVLRFNMNVPDQGNDDLLDCLTYGIALGMGNAEGF